MKKRHDRGGGGYASVHNAAVRSALVDAKTGSTGFQRQEMTLSPCAPTTTAAPVAAGPSADSTGRSTNVPSNDLPPNDR